MRIVLAVAVVMVAAGCAYEPLDAAPEPIGALDNEDGQALVAVDPHVSTDAVREPLEALVDKATPAGGHPKSWQFAVLSDLHLPNPRSAVIDREVAALVRMKVRFVVVTGDHTNGSAVVDHRRGRAEDWWAAVTEALEPLRDAGISVLPIAGNHDTYLPWHRDGYETTFGDLARWAAPLELHPAMGSGFARAPYSYSVDVDGLHLTLANIVDQDVDRDVAAWLGADLASATATHARARFVFGHVPLFSVVRRPARHFVAQLGPILARGHVDYYVAGHEHLSWDETVAVGAGAALRQVLVGCASGFYVFAPSKTARERAGCEAPSAAGVSSCTMPNGGRFELVRDRSGRMLEHDTATFTVFTVTGDDIEVTPMTLDADGEPRSFYLLPG